ncbi:MAG TPA: hypothetical protein VM846_02080 [Vicinamibacterales bacterium]|jgi:hypothetical protein|nr:hypothetical protein [Vicinamibacterales bacterium]
MWTRLTFLTVCALAFCSQVALTQSTPVVRGINGSWEGYPVRGDGFGSGVQPKVRVPAPAAIPEPPLKQPYLDEWRSTQTRNQELSRKGLPPTSTGMACVPEGMPGLMGATFPLEILETPGQVTIIEEAFNQVRRVYLGAPALAPEDAEPRFAGNSTGRWMGDTLVVETVGVKESVRFRNTPHSMKMRITERMRLVNDEILENQVTVDDPEFLTKPWTWTWMYKRWPGYKIEEYICEDNRYFEDPVLKYQRLKVN